MSRGTHNFLTFLFLFILITQSISARLLQNNQEFNSPCIHTVSSSSMTRKEEEEDMASLMGLEECNENDEACLKRRMIAEAHLDYIYTQHHKPKGSP